jgi:hypothetical protein
MCNLYDILNTCSISVSTILLSSTFLAICFLWHKSTWKYSHWS